MHNRGLSGTKIFLLVYGVASVMSQGKGLEKSQLKMNFRQPVALIDLCQLVF